jgi:magnesium chelatase subunit D
VTERLATALAVLAVDPMGVGGLWLRGRAGPVRDAVVAALPPARRIHPGIDDAALFGALDLAATLATGQAVTGRGVLGDPGLLCLTMAERCPPGLAARLGVAMDAGSHGVVALDEGDGDEAPPPALTDRLGLFLATDGLVWSDMAALAAPDVAQAQAALPFVTAPAGIPEALARVAARLGAGSMRAPLQALACARALAALAGRGLVTEADVRTAVELTLAHRALPTGEAEQSPPPPPPEDSRPGESRDLDLSTLPDELLVAAARAALPPDLIAALAAGRAARAAKGATGTGGAKAGNRRGRPLPSRAGRLGTGARVDLIATLRNAAPWQPLRRQSASKAGRSAALHIRPADIRLKRFVETSDRVLIFAVDASGSAALARLAEAKGAVELMLAAAYARRDHVALVAFRGTGAEVMLPPTRSLVQTKRRLAGLPGGGGTPLAAGLQAALALAVQARARGMTPTIALLTDGRANIARDGSADRPRAGAEAEEAARLIAASGIAAVVIDTATRPQPALSALARAMAAPCLPLPRADARVMQAAIAAAMG